MTAPSLARMCAEAVADLTAGGCLAGVTAAEVALWITDGGDHADPAEVTAELERLALRRLIRAVHPVQRSEERLWLPGLRTGERVTLPDRCLLALAAIGGEASSRQVRERVAADFPVTQQDVTTCLGRMAKADPPLVLGRLVPGSRGRLWRAAGTGEAAA